MKINRMYTQVANKHVLQYSKFKNAILAFISGGCIGALSQYAYVICTEWLHLKEQVASNYIVLFVIIVTSLFTGLGLYDKVAQIFGAGLFIPISGFANALTSCAMEAKNEGLIYGIGSNLFKLAGSVITYGIVSTYIFGILRYFLQI